MLVRAPPQVQAGRPCAPLAPAAAAAAARRSATPASRGCSRTSRGGRSRRAVAAGAAKTGEPAAAEPESFPWAQPGYLGAAVSQLPEQQQAAVFVGISAALAVGTWANASVVGPAVLAVLPPWLQVTSTSWFPLGPIFIAAGVAHFTEKRGFINMYPHRGAWGLWWLPGSAEFHVLWTGVAEILGGAGLIVGALPLDFAPAIGRASALGLFLLTAAVTPANIFMFTHNAPGPLPESVAPGALPWQGHAARGVMQVLLLSALWGIATASS